MRVCTYFYFQFAFFNHFIAFELWRHFKYPSTIRLPRTALPVYPIDNCRKKPKLLSVSEMTRKFSQTAVLSLKFLC